MINKKFFYIHKLYIFFLYIVLFLNITFLIPVNANIFKIKDLEISEPFELNFDKRKVINNGFKLAFDQLLSTISTTEDKKKLEKTSLASIKTLIDSFKISEERFIENKYYAKIEVNFNKELTLKFFEKKNIFPSIPKRKKILFIPIFYDEDSDQIYVFEQNKFYSQWNQSNESFYLLEYILPSEDLDDFKNIIQNKDNIEEYDFKEMISKYDLDDYIIAIIFNNKNKIRILSKINIKQNLKIHNFSENDFKLDSDVESKKLFRRLKLVYENYWKATNRINTSIKLPLTIVLNSNDYKNIEELEKTLFNLELVSKFEIEKFDNNRIYYKVIYNGSPKKFIEDMNDKRINISLQDNVWKIE